MPLIDVLNEQGLRTGVSLSRLDIHKAGHIHRAVHFYLFDYSSNILLQCRSDTADHYPGMFSISVTGHVDAGESSGQAMIREIEEELGLDAKNLKINFLFSFRRDACLAPDYTDRQFNDVYMCQHDFALENIRFDKQSITALQLVSWKKFIEMVNDPNSNLAPVYADECRDVLYFCNHLLSKQT